MHLLLLRDDPLHLWANGRPCPFSIASIHRLHSVIVSRYPFDTIHQPAEQTGPMQRLATFTERADANKGPLNLYLTSGS